MAQVRALATWVSSIFYGAFLVLYWGCFWVLTTKRRSTGISKHMLCTATLMVVVATLHNAVSVQRDIEAFFEHKDGNPIRYFALSSNFANLFQSCLFTAQIVVGDALLVYRCYVAYGRDPRILFLPVFLLLGTLACGIVLAYQFAIVDGKSVDDQTYFGDIVQPWSTGLKVVSVAQNIVTTAAIAIKIWRIGLGSHRRLYWRAIMLVVESGAIYIVIMLMLIILNLIKQNSYAIVYYAMVPIIGIIFTSMIIAVGLRDIGPVTTEIATGSVLQHENLSHKHKRPVGAIIFTTGRSRGTAMTETQDTDVIDTTFEHPISLSELARQSSKDPEP